MSRLPLSAALCVLTLSLCATGVSYPQRYSLYSTRAGRQNAMDTQSGEAVRATSRYRNWCAYVVTRVVSCVIEDGVATYVKPEYQPCGWGQVQCPRAVMYRSFMKPRYKVAYKMVTEMEWRCCHGYSGDDCSVSPPGLSEEEGHRHDARQPIGSPEEGRSNSDKSRQMEEKIQRLTQQVHNLQTTIETMNEKFQEGMQRAIESVLNGKQPADAASHPDMKETINEIQSKLHQIDNRVKVHDGEIDLLNTIRISVTGDARSDIGQKLSDLKEELVREVELRIQNSCFSCRADIELLRQQQEKFRQQLRELGRIFNGTEQHNRLLIENMHKHISGLTGSTADSCCAELESTKSKVEDVESKLVSLSDVVSGLEQKFHRKSPDSTSGTTQWDEQFQKQFHNIERKLNLTEVNLEKRFMSHLKNLRGEIGERIYENKGRLNTLVSVLGNGTVFDNWLRETVDGLGEDVTTLKKKAGADGRSLGLVVSQLHELESKVQKAVDGCAQSCNPSLLTQYGQDSAEMVDTLTKLQKKIVENEFNIQDTGKRVHNLTIGGSSLRNRLQQFGQEVKQLKLMIHSNEEQMKVINSSLKDLEGKMQTSAETSFTFYNTIKDEVLWGRNETNSHINKLTEELEEEKQRFNHFENYSSTCLEFQIELDRLKEVLSDPTKHYKDLLIKIENINNTLKRFGMFGGKLGVDLGSMQGELQDVILTFNSVNSTLKALQDIVHQQGHNTDILNTTFSTSNNKLIADISRIQEKITDHAEETENKFVNFQSEWGTFRGHMMVEFRECKDSGEGLEQRVSKLEKVCTKLDSVSQSLEKIKEGLNRHVSSLWNCQREFNATLQRHSGVLQNIKDIHLRNLTQIISILNHSMTDIHTEVHNFTQNFIGTEGPPGPRGLPGPEGPSGVSAHVERVSFSAALTNPQHHAGTILFDKVLVNEGSHYNPGTGIFTVPLDGRYFISAILTGHRNQRIEAVLAKSNTGLARIDSGGFQPEGLENRPVMGPQPASGSLGIFNIILPLSKGDTVCIDLVTGKLAHSDEPLTIFNGVLLYEDEDI